VKTKVCEVYYYLAQPMLTKVTFTELTW